MTRPNGVNTSYNYDSVSHLLSVLHQTGTTTLDGASYSYDFAGNRTSKTNYLNGVTSNYGYDAIYELLQVTQGGGTTESYSYDAVGNRLSSTGVPTYSYNSSNELTSNSSGSYTYDNNGNTLTDVSGKSYTWDFENRMVSVLVPGTGTVNFKYDPFGRRIQKSSSLGTTSYLYDGDNIVEEVDANANVVARHTQGINVDEHLSELRSSTASYYEQDGLESVSSLSTSVGALANNYNYDSFGNLVASSGILANPFQYTGRDNDAETGLRYYRARYYDSHEGRFISEDPARFSGGFDFYGYVKNDPVDFMDPTGLACEQVSPWTEIPSMYGSNGPSPYLTIQDGVNWVSAGWKIYGIGFVECRCKWVATHTRIRKFYRVTVTEQAEFKCGCPPSTEFKTRERTKEYEADSPGPWIMPGETEYTYGFTFQLGSNAGTHPKVWPGSVSCSCMATPPAP